MPLASSPRLAAMVERESWGQSPCDTLEKLQEAIPEFEWTKGHSGVLLTEEVVTKLDEMCEEE